MKKAYTPEQTKRLRELYIAHPQAKTINALAMEFGKTHKSVLSKLVLEGLHTKTPYVTKQGEKPVSKETHAGAICKALHLDAASDIAALARANKNVLKILIDKLGVNHE
jgi:hypothetical protein